MQFFTIATALAFASVAVAQGSTCFDDGDCIFASGGKKCVKKSGSITGTCGTPASSSAAAVPTSGSICFDAGDCFFQGGNCVKKSGAITGYCAPAPSGSSGSIPGLPSFSIPTSFAAPTGIKIPGGKKTNNKRKEFVA